MNHYSKSDKFKEEFKETCQEKYGVNAPAQCPEIYQKVKETCLKNIMLKIMQRQKNLKKNLKIHV